jgi:hypothetical protein
MWRGQRVRFTVLAVVVFQEEFSRVTGRTIVLGLRTRVRALMAVLLVSSIASSFALGQTDGRLSWWQYVVCTLGAVLLTLTPLLWYVVCCGLASAAKALGDELEQVRLVPPKRLQLSANRHCSEVWALCSGM